MAALALDQAARLTELGKITITRAIKCSWLARLALLFNRQQPVDLFAHST
jgi:hypothetical protein